VPLPINIVDLFTGTTVEWERLECKAGWNPEEVLHSLCAFANDFHNWGGGYLVIGVAERDGRPVLPPVGVPAGRIDTIQKELLNLAHRLQPTYFPVVEPAMLDGRHIVVIWTPGGQNRPYKAPVSLSKGEKQYAYYVRMGAASVAAKGSIEQELLQLAASVPFDDRMNHHAEVGDLQLRLIQAHLHAVKSTLADAAPAMDFVRLCRQMRIVDGPDEDPRPRNVGLLFFTERPEQFFDTAWIDVVHMPEGPAGREFREVRFTGPLDAQLRAALAYVRERFIEERTLKWPERAEADRFVTFPYEAVEEALANAVYHRGYDVREPIEVRVTPEALTITSYPGPDPSVRIDALRTGRVVARRYRNRRIGEFLKELRLTEGRGTGVPTMLRAMRDNGSPEPVFETDDARSYFTVVLPVHPLALERSPRGRSAGEESDQARAVSDQVGDQAATSDAVVRLLGLPLAREILAFATQPRSRAEIQEHVGRAHATHLQRRYLRPLIAAGLLAQTQPEAPRAPTQRYVATPLARRLVSTAAPR